MNRWVDLLGFDRSLYSLRSKAFTITFHCTNPFDVYERFHVSTEIENLCNIEAISRFGKDSKVKLKGAKVFILENKLN